MNQQINQNKYNTEKESTEFSTLPAAQTDTFVWMLSYTSMIHGLSLYVFVVNIPVILPLHSQSFYCILLWEISAHACVMHLFVIDYRKEIVCQYHFFSLEIQIRPAKS